MSRSLTSGLLAALASILLIAGCNSGDKAAESGSTGASSTQASKTNFSTDVRPTLEAHCLPCHGEGGKGGLNVTTDAAKDLAPKMLVQLESRRMPPANAPTPLSDEDRAKLIEKLKSL